MSDAPVSYAYRAKPFAAETRLELGRTELIAWQADRKYIYPYRSIETVRLFFAPSGIDFSGYRAKIYARDGKTVSLEDRTFKSLVQVERQGPSYRAFIVEFCRRVEAGNPDVLLHAGRHPLRMALTGVAGVALTAMLAFISSRAASQGQIMLTLAIVGFTALFAVWSWRFVVRNRSRRFAASAIPEAVLPPA